MIRLVLDTNTVVSALFWKGLPHSLIRRATTGQVELVTSQPLLLELEDVLKRRKLAKVIAAANVSVSDVLTKYADLTDIVSPVEITRTVIDPDDDVVLGTALAGHAGYVVTGDAHLLSLREVQGVMILQASHLDQLIR